MEFNRRSFMTTASLALMTSVGATEFVSAPPDRSRIRALAFDAFTIFDPRPIFHACEAAFPGRGAQLADLWRVRQFEYQWLRALAGSYVDFWEVTASALDFAAQALQLQLSSAQRAALMQGYLRLEAWPDVADALAMLQRSGRTSVLLSNATGKILASGIRNSGLGGLFQHVISTDRIRSFKPDPRAYRLAVDVLGLPKEEILFVAFAGWDVAGARWFGYPTFWNNRQNATPEQLDVAADGTGTSLMQLVSYLEADMPGKPSYQRSHRRPA